jgi:hypothetical protein
VTCWPLLAGYSFGTGAGCHPSPLADVELIMIEVVPIRTLAMMDVTFLMERTLIEWWACIEG